MTITHYQGKYLNLCEHSDWEYASRNTSGVAVLIPVTENSELVLVEQYRIPVGRAVIELPAGLVGDVDQDETLLTAAGRELEEETGYQAVRLTLGMRCPTSAGLSDEIADFIFADGLQRVGAGGGDSTEDITVHIIPLDQIDTWLNTQAASGKMIDAKIYSALYWLQQSEKTKLSGRNTNC